MWCRRALHLLEQLSLRLGVELAAPDDDPTSSNGRRTWQPALERIVAGIHALREPMLLRHAVGCLGSGTDGDHALVDAYVRAIWGSDSNRTRNNAERVTDEQTGADAIAHLARPHTGTSTGTASTASMSSSSPGSFVLYASPPAPGP
jgi:hypothetical protein